MALSLMNWLCSDFSEQIRVNTVNPTVVMTEMGRLGWSDPKKAKTMTSRIPLGRFAGNRRYRLQHKAATELCNTLSLFVCVCVCVCVFVCRGGGRGEQYFIPAE